MINEHDLADWEQLEPTPLYSVPRNRYINWLGEYYWFDHIDGMYSYCMTMSGNVVHISASAIVNELRKPEKTDDTV